MMVRRMQETKLNSSIEIQESTDKGKSMLRTKATEPAGVLLWIFVGNLEKLAYNGGRSGDIHDYDLCTYQ